MDKEQLNKYKLAGKIAAQLLNYAKKICKQEVKLIDIAEKVEEKLLVLNQKYNCNARFAFPINISINEIAAHYSPTHNDNTLAHGLVKIDLGVHIDGFIADTALSVDLTDEQEHKELIKANKEALEKAIAIIKDGVSLYDIANVIETKAKQSGFNVISNLTGHEVKQYNLHAGLTIPNVTKDINDLTLKQDQVIAIEPFFTYGVGYVRNAGPSCIFKLQEEKILRDKQCKQLLSFIKQNYDSLPFSSRWLVRQFGTSALLRLKLLQMLKAVYNFPVLKEISNSPTSQFEHTMIVTKDKALVTTKQE